jgi:hypothetical protein
MKRSRAAAVAAQIKEISGGQLRAPPPAPTDKASKELVEKSALVFEHLRSLPPFEEDSIRDGVRAFLRFVERVETGGIADDAKPLADLVVQRGYEWLADHPAYVPVPTSIWNLEMVESAVVLFNERTREEPDARVAEELAGDLRTFEAVLRSGCVESGDAEHLAHAFLEYAHRWLDKHPRVQQRYEALAS